MASTKLSSTLKALVAAPHAQGGPVPLPSQSATLRLFEGLSRSATSKGLGQTTWLTLSVSPDLYSSVLQLANRLFSPLIRLLKECRFSHPQLSCYSLCSLLLCNERLERWIRSGTESE